MSSKMALISSRPGSVLEREGDRLPAHAGSLGRATLGEKELDLGIAREGLERVFSSPLPPPSLTSRFTSILTRSKLYNRLVKKQAKLPQLSLASFQSVHIVLHDCEWRTWAGKVYHYELTL